MSSPSPAAYDLHLLVEAQRSPVTKAEECPCLAVPAGASYLFAAEDGEPILSNEPRLSPAAMAVIEPVSAAAQPQLVLVNQGLSSLRINGQPAPLVALLAEKDQLQLASGGPVLHVTLYHRPRVGPPPEEFLGKECPVCRLALAADTTVYICGCGAAIHLEGEEKSADERLECLKFSPDCPICSSPIVLSRGYSYVPEL